MSAFPGAETGRGRNVRDGLGFLISAFMSLPLPSAGVLRSRARHRLMRTLARGLAQLLPPGGKRVCREGLPLGLCVEGHLWHYQLESHSCTASEQADCVSREQLIAVCMQVSAKATLHFFEVGGGLC